jgi:spermidine/putrescine-binding protein
MRHVLIPWLILLSSLLACGRGTPSLHLYLWSEYMPPEVVDEFTERTGIRCTLDTYDSNEALLEKLQSGVVDYDLVAPSDYMVRILIELDLLAPLDAAQVPNRRHLDPAFLDQTFDPENRYSLPLFWGTTGIGYRKSAVAEPVHSWGALFDSRYKGRILMLDDVREVFAVALKSMGRSLNETDPAVLRQAAEMLKEQKALVATYNSGDFDNLLLAGDVDLSHGYNGQFAKVIAATGEELAYVVPEEGGTLWLDNLVIPASAKNVEAAHRFVDYLLEPEVSARIVNRMRYASTNQAARSFIEPSILADVAIYPPPETLTRCELMSDLGETTTLLDELWTEIKAQ